MWVGYISPVEMQYVYHPKLLKQMEHDTFSMVRMLIQIGKKTWELSYAVMWYGELSIRTSLPGIQLHHEKNIFMTCTLT